MSANNISLEEIRWKPDKKTNTPVYLQISNYICGKIANGDWVIGRKLPPQRDLAKLFEVNRSTIVEAMEELKSLGVIDGSSGGGTTIINNTWSMLMSVAPTNWNRYINSGSFHSNLETIQTINQKEFEDGIIRLGTGELSPSLIPNLLDEGIIRSLANKNISFNYLGPLGLPELRQSISRHIKKLGIDISPDGILISSGSLQALQLISVCMLRPKSTVYVEIPSYLKSLQVFQSADMYLSGVPMDSEGIMYWNLDKSDFKDNSSLLYTIPTNHNPTGLIMSEKRRRDLVNYCKKKRLPIIEDDAYRDLWLENEPPMPLKTMDDGGNILYMGTVSKSLAPGLRIGFIAGPESVVERLGDVKMQTDYGSSSLSQWVLAEWLDSGRYDKHIVWLRKKLLTRRDTALRLLDKYFKDIAWWNKPLGGFYIWVRLKKKINTDRLFVKALDEKILINPGSIYDFDKNQFLRLSYAYASLDELEYGMERLSKIITNM